METCQSTRPLNTNGGHQQVHRAMSDSSSKPAVLLSPPVTSPMQRCNRQSIQGYSDNGDEEKDEFPKCVVNHQTKSRDGHQRVSDDHDVQRERSRTIHGRFSASQPQLNTERRNKGQRRYSHMAAVCSKSNLSNSGTRTLNRMSYAGMSNAESNGFLGSNFRSSYNISLLKRSYEDLRPQPIAVPTPTVPKRDISISSSSYSSEDLISPSDSSDMSVTKAQLLSKWDMSEEVFEELELSPVETTTPLIPKTMHSQEDNIKHPTNGYNSDGVIQGPIVAMHKLQSHIERDFQHDRNVSAVKPSQANSHVYHKVTDHDHSVRHSIDFTDGPNNNTHICSVPTHFESNQCTSTPTEGNLSSEHHDVLNNNIGNNDLHQVVNYPADRFHGDQEHICAVALHTSCSPTATSDVVVSVATNESDIVPQGNYTSSSHSSADYGTRNTTETIKTGGTQLPTDSSTLCAQSYKFQQQSQEFTASQVDPSSDYVTPSLNGNLAIPVSLTFSSTIQEEQDMASSDKDESLSSMSAGSTLTPDLPHAKTTNAFESLSRTKSLLPAVASVPQQQGYSASSQMNSMLSSMRVPIGASIPQETTTAHTLQVSTSPTASASTDSSKGTYKDSIQGHDSPGSVSNSSFDPVLRRRSCSLPPFSKVPQSGFSNRVQRATSLLDIAEVDETVQDLSQVEMKLSDYISLNLNSLPKQVKVCKGFCCEASEVSMSQGEIFNLHFVRYTKIVTVCDSHGNCHSVPFNSIVRCSVLYDPFNAKQVALQGFQFKSAKEIMGLKRPPTIIAATQDYTGKSHESSVDTGEVLVVNGVKFKDRLRVLKVYSVKYGETKLLQEDCAGSFTTKIANTRMSIADLFQAPVPLPQKAVLHFPSEMSKTIQSSLLESPVTLSQFKVLTSVIATSPRTMVYSKTQATFQTLDIAADLNVEVQEVSDLSKGMVAELEKLSRSVHHYFNPAKVVPYIEAVSSQVFRVQHAFWTNTDARNLMSGVILEIPESIQPRQKEQVIEQTDQPTLQKVQTTGNKGDDSCHKSSSATHSSLSSSTSLSMTSMFELEIRLKAVEFQAKSTEKNITKMSQQLNEVTQKVNVLLQNKQCSSTCSGNRVSSHEAQSSPQSQLFQNENAQIISHGMLPASTYALTKPIWNHRDETKPVLEQSHSQSDPVQRKYSNGKKPPLAPKPYVFPNPKYQQRKRSNLIGSMTESTLQTKLLTEMNVGNNDTVFSPGDSEQVKLTSVVGDVQQYQLQTDMDSSECAPSKNSQSQLDALVNDLDKWCTEIEDELNGFTVTTMF